MTLASYKSKKPKDDVYWTTKDGTKILVDDMTVDHLRFALKMIIRKADSLKKPKHRFVELNGDIAQSMIDDMIDDDESGIGSFDPEFWKF